MGSRPYYDDEPGEEFEDDPDTISLAIEDDEPDLGPDERDADLMDGRWEAEYYAPNRRTRDWNAIVAGVALLVVIAMLLPMLLVVFD